MRTMKTHRSKNGPNPKKHRAKPATAAHKRKDKANPTEAGNDAIDNLRLISKLQKEADIATNEADDAKKVARDKTGVARQKQKAVSDAIHEATKPLLFSPQTVKAVKEGNAEPIIPPADDDAWRETKIETLTVDGKIIKGRIVQALKNTNISSLGDYFDWVKPNDNGFGNRLASIKGLGESAVTEFENAIEQAMVERQKQLKAAASKAVDTVAESTAMPAADAQPSTNGDGYEEAETADEAGDE